MSKRVSSVLLILGLLTAIGLGNGCSGSDTSVPEQAASKPAPATAAGAESSEPMPEWIERSRSWPDTIRLVFDSTFETVMDGLLLRLRPEIVQDVSGQQFQNEKPLGCGILMTVRPIPTWPHAKGLVLDSVIFHDPVKNRNLRTMPMLAFQRSYEEQTVRTQFLPNMADALRQSPDLTEGQLLEPTIFLSWDGRQFIVSEPGIAVTFMRNP